MSGSSYSPIVIKLPRPRDGSEQHLVSSETNPGVFYLVIEGTSRHARCAHPAAYGSKKPADICKHIDAVFLANRLTVEERMARHARGITEYEPDITSRQIPAETFREYRARKAAEAAPAPVPALPARPGRGLYG